MKSRQSRYRRMSFAEGSILFILILGATLMLGLKVASDNDRRSPGQTGIQEQRDAVAADPVEFLPAQPPEDTDTFEPAPDWDAFAQEPVTYPEAQSAYLAGDYVAAAVLFDAYTLEEPSNPWGFYMLGLAAWKAGDPDTAAEGFLQALEIRPDHLPALVNYSRLLLDMGRTDEARVQIDRALAVDPRDAQAGRVLGRVLHNQGLLAEAEEAYRRVLAEHPQDAWSLNNLGLILIQRDRCAQAVPALAKASLLLEGTACVQNNLGIALERTGRYRAAAEAFALAVKTAPDHAAAVHNFARVQGLQEDPVQPAFDLAAAAASFSPREGILLAQGAPADSAGSRGLADALAAASGEPAPDAEDVLQDNLDDPHR